MADLDDFFAKKDKKKKSKGKKFTSKTPTTLSEVIFISIDLYGLKNVKMYVLCEVSIYTTHTSYT